MTIEHIKASDQATTQWTGGTTTQLVIYPKDADYKKRNFLFRISTAKVESEESVFTKLPNVSRKLLILDGEIKIEHKNHYSKILQKYEQDSFSGNWDTKSYGKATDFNLMTTGTTEGEIEAKYMKEQETVKISDKTDMVGLYLYSGQLELQDKNKDYKVNNKDFLLIHFAKSPIELTAIKESEIIITKIILGNSASTNL